MAWLREGERRFLEAVSGLCFCNPFLPERIDWERRALGRAFDEPSDVWSRHPGEDATRPNVLRLREQVRRMVRGLRTRVLDVAGGQEADQRERQLYVDLVAYHLYDELRDQFAVAHESDRSAAALWGVFSERYRHFLDLPGLWIATGSPRPSDATAAHWMAGMSQLGRGFQEIYSHIVGRSLPAARLRAAVWQSIFTCDLRAYRDGLFRRMADFSTLVTGPSGTGKELVARAIAAAAYVPFDAKRCRWEADLGTGFFALNLSALTPTLIESELFGHRRGAFTGAVADRQGWLESCPSHGVVFMDEIGELDESIQVKLLRVLQSRAFQRLGETSDRHFAGRVVAATNRDLPQAVEDRRFREDLYYRLCSDTVCTPGLAERLRACPEELGDLLQFLLVRIAGPEGEALAAEIEAWVLRRLGHDYAWPGNIRELEQVIRNYLIRRDYQPLLTLGKTARADVQVTVWAERLAAGELTAEELLAVYCQLVYRQEGTYDGAAKRLGLDRRTVRAKVLRAVGDQATATRSDACDRR